MPGTGGRGAGEVGKSWELEWRGTYIIEHLLYAGPSVFLIQLPK